MCFSKSVIYPTILLRGHLHTVLVLQNKTPAWHITGTQLIFVEGRQEAKQPA